MGKLKQVSEIAGISYFSSVEEWEKYKLIIITFFQERLSHGISSAAGGGFGGGIPGSHAAAAAAARGMADFQPPTAVSVPHPYFPPPFHTTAAASAAAAAGHQPQVSAQEAAFAPHLAAAAAAGDPYANSLHSFQASQVCLYKVIPLSCVLAFQINYSWSPIL